MIGLILWLIVIIIITFSPNFFLFTFVIIPLVIAAVFGVFELLARLTTKRK